LATTGPFGGPWKKAKSTLRSATFFDFHFQTEPLPELAANEERDTLIAIRVFDAVSCKDRHSFLPELIE
jgi:hypothetical protein